MVFKGLPFPQNDLKQLFAMIDVKGTGLIDPEEFIQPLSRWVHESKTANRFVKYNVMRTIQQNDERLSGTRNTS